MKKILVLVLIFLVILISGCVEYTSLKEIKENPENYLGKEIFIKGNVSNILVVKDISGFVIREGNNAIYVSSKHLPPKNSEVVVRGVLKKQNLIGYYISAKEIREKKGLNET